MSAKQKAPRITVITGKLDIHITRNRDGQVLVKIPPAIPHLQSVVDKIVLALSGDSNIRISGPDTVLTEYTHPYRPLTPSPRKRSNSHMENEGAPPPKRARISNEAYPGVVFESIEVDYDEADPVLPSSPDTDKRRYSHRILHK